MDVYSVPELGNADAYLIRGTTSNPHLTSPQLEPFEAMYNEGAQEFVVDQGLYYPSATNYGYICTGLESPGDWDDHHRVFGLDGQDIQFIGAQNESLPYVYYTPSYGFSQSPYNPYNPYIPGAMIGVDGHFVGAQQYYTIPAYENAASSPAYFPMLVQPGSEVISNSITNPLMEPAASAANIAEAPAFKRNLSSTSAKFTLNPGRSASNQTTSLTRIPEGIKANGGSSKLPAANGSVGSNSLPAPASSQVLQGRSAQSIENLSHGKALSNLNQLKVALPSGNALSNFGSSANGRVFLDKVRPKLQFSRVASDINGNADATSEQNRGPRTNKPKNHLAVKAYTTRAGDSDAQGNIIINTDQYNKDDFPVDYANAKFFVIKSYSEDDVHKSIKYNVWSSTPNGNKKLHTAYEDAQKIGAGEPKGCPVFLFFSVNASGQFCGVAEMMGKVDFHKDMDFWQQDKWSGSFPVKWHIIKDVPNPNFRHIILENNEHKPVTNSRDTQEIRYKKGLEMLRVFKNYTSKTSILDDFLYYENRQKMLQEEKARLLIRSYGTPLFVPVLDPPRKLNGLIDLPANADKKRMKHDDLESSDGEVAAPSGQVTLNADLSKPNVADNVPKQVADGNKTENDVLKIGELTISPKPAKPKPTNGNVASRAATVSVADTKPGNVVTVGSMPVKVNGFTESSGFLTVGTIQFDPKALQVGESGASTNLTKTVSQKDQQKRG